MDETGQVTVSNSDGVATVVASGTCNLYYVDEFNKALSEVVAAGDEIVVDFREASFIDSAFLVALVAPARARLKKNARLKILVTDGAYPQYVLKMVGFHDLMDIVAEDSASAAEGQ